MAKRMLTIGTILVSISLLSACAPVKTQQDYDADITARLSSLSEWDALTEGMQLNRLNDVFKSDEVDRLLALADTHNPSLQQSLLNLQIAQAQVTQTSAQQKPQLNADLSALRQENSQDTFNSELSVSWQLDMWGKLRDATQATELDLEQQRYLTQSVRDSLAASILNSWLSLIAQKNAIGIEQKRRATLQQNESYIIQRYRNGLGTLNDLDTARTSTANSRATLESTQQAFQQGLRDLRTLVGQLSQDEFRVPEHFPEVTLSHIPLPEQTLRQRPDLKAAYLAIKAADLRSSVAYKELLPSFNIQAALNESASSLREALFVSPVWSLLGQLTAPLYQGGQLRAETEIAQLQTAYSYQSYRTILLTAVNEVESTIDRERSLTIQITHLKTALNSALNNLQQYQKSYRTGLVDMLDLLTIQQQTFDIESQLNSMSYALLSNRVSLGLALGLEIQQ